MARAMAATYAPSEHAETARRVFPCMFSRLTMTIARSMDMEKPQGKAVMRTLAPPERSALIHGTMSKSRLARIAQ